MDNDEQHDQPEAEPRRRGLCRRFFKDDTRRELWILFSLSWPVILTQGLQLLLNTITVIFCGRLGELELAVVSISLSVASVTGISIAYGMCTAMDTLCSQAYGANNLFRVGLIVQRAICIMGICCLPVWAVWLNSQSLLSLFVEDPEVARYTEEFMDAFLPAYPMLILCIIMQKYMQALGIVRPLFYIGIAANAFHVGSNYFFIFGLDRGISGAAAALDCTILFQAIVTLVYIRVKGHHKKTWKGWSTECLLEWGTFLHLALPGMVMLCIEWWSFEVGTILMGNLGTAILAAQGAILQTAVILFDIPHGLSIAACILVGRHLGEGEPETAKRTAWMCLKITVTLGAIVAVFILALKDYVGPLFTEDKEVLAIISEVILVVPAYMIFDFTQTVCSGVIRGCGYQRIGAVINFVSFDLVGIPLGAVLAFKTPLLLTGFWIGLSVGLALQSILYLTTIIRLNWGRVSALAIKRAGGQTETTMIGEKTVVHMVDHSDETQEDSASNNGREMEMLAGVKKDESVSDETNDIDSTEGQTSEMIPKQNPINNGDISRQATVQVTGYIIIKRVLVVSFGLLILGAGITLRLVSPSQYYLVSEDSVIYDNTSTSLNSSTTSFFNFTRSLQLVRLY